MSVFGGDMFTNTTTTSTASTANVTLESLIESMRQVREKFGNEPIITEYSLTPAPWMIDHEQVRFPRSKAFRIRKKWRKNLDNWHNVPQQQVYCFGGRIIAHPTIIEKMKAAMVAPNSSGGAEREGEQS